MTKVAVTPASARLRHPDAVRADLAAATRRAFERLDRARPFDIGSPVRVRLRLSDVTTPQILEAIPGVRQVDGYRVGFTADSMDRAYRLIRLMYRFASIWRAARQSPRPL
ncbi:MAG TPA: M55 family metallopeptidase [Longimicrobiales bacterium]